MQKTTITWSITWIQQHNHFPTHISTNMAGLVLVLWKDLFHKERDTKWFRNSKQIHLMPASVSLSMLGNNSHGSLIPTVKLCNDRSTAEHQICPEPCFLPSFHAGSPTQLNFVYTERLADDTCNTDTNFPQARNYFKMKCGCSLTAYRKYQTMWKILHSKWEGEFITNHFMKT